MVVLAIGGGLVGHAEECSPGMDWGQITTGGLHTELGIGPSSQVGRKWNGMPGCKTNTSQ